MDRSRRAVASASSPGGSGLTYRASKGICIALRRSGYSRDLLFNTLPNHVRESVHWRTAVLAGPPLVYKGEPATTLSDEEVRKRLSV